MAYWITRDNYGGAKYDLWLGYPKKGPHLWGSRGGIYLGSFQVRQFHKIFIPFKPGEIRKVKSINIELEGE